MPGGTFRAAPGACLGVDFFFGDKFGEVGSKEAVDEDGEELPPQPKKDPSLDPFGDLGGGVGRIFVLLFIVVELFVKFRVPALLSGKVRCGGDGLVENIDMAACGVSLKV
jgi:hypothetical protein